MEYLKRTFQKNPRVLGKNVVKEKSFQWAFYLYHKYFKHVTSSSVDIFKLSIDTAKSLEGRGVKAIMKDLMKPENEVRITDITTDGDTAPCKIASGLVWDEGDGVPDALVGQKVVKNEPKLHRG